MLKKRPILMSVTALLVAALACVQPGAAPAPALDPNAVNTSIVQTIIARQTQEVLNNPPTATFTFTPEAPTLTAEPTSSPVPDFTATSSTPQITVSVDTNCRTGPGAVFERVGILLVGETAEIVGREPKGEYWYIRNPDLGTEFCWVWGEYATVTGNLLPLLFVSPPPPPSAAFGLSFEKLGTCATWWVDFKLANTSGALFKSISVTLTDTDTNPVTIVAKNENGFIKNDGCGAPVKTDSLAAGSVVTVSSPQFAYNPTGHTLKAKVTICTDTDQKGTCITNEITFKP